MTAGWYVVEARDGRDAEVYNRLAAYGYRVWRPVYVVRLAIRRSGLARETRYAPVFGRYLFANVAMCASVQAAIREVAGVHGWLCMAGTDEPARLPDDLIASYQQQMAKPLEGLQSRDEYAVGDRVAINDGPYAGHVVKVIAVDRRGVLVLGLCIFDGEVPVPMHPARVTLVEAAKRKRKA